MSYLLNTSVDTFYTMLTQRLEGYEGPDLFLGKAHYFVEIDRKANTFAVYHRRFFSMRVLLKGHLNETNGATQIVLSSPMMALLMLIVGIFVIGVMSSVHSHHYFEGMYTMLLLMWVLYRMALCRSAKQEITAFVQQAAQA